MARTNADVTDPWHCGLLEVFSQLLCGSCMYEQLPYLGHLGNSFVTHQSIELIVC